MADTTTSQKVNKLGKYLRKHIDGAYKIGFSPNTCDVYITLYYQIPGDDKSFKEMHFDINITTYQEKIRVNITAMDDMEKTIGQLIYKPQQLVPMDVAVTKIYQDICRKVENEYQDYDFVF